MSDPFSHHRYTLRSRFFRLFGGVYELFDEHGVRHGYAEMKRFRLREDIRLYADADKAEPLLAIRTQSVFDFSGAYDVADATGERIGTLQRSGMRSTFMRDHWTVLDAQGMALAELQEDSPTKAILRRLIDTVEFLSWLGYLLPQRYDWVQRGTPCVHFQHHINPLIYKLDVSLRNEGDVVPDRRLVVAMAILLAAIEGRQ